MRKKLIVMVITFSLILVLTSSYAILRSSKLSKNNYVINVGDLKVKFKENQTEKLNLTNMYPMSDEEGMNQEDELRFTIENTGSILSYYNITIEETSTSPEFKSVIKFVSNKNDEGYNEPKILKDDKYIDFRGYINPGETITYKVKVWLTEEADSTYMGKQFKAKVVINAIQNTNEYDLYDKSGNNYNAKFMNGAKIITDENFRKAISFDGVDDYVDIDDLPATIDWANGFTVEFEAEWKGLNWWSRIFDFGTEGIILSGSDGNDNIFIANSGYTNMLNIDTRYEKSSRGFTNLENAIELNTPIKFKTVLTKENNSFIQKIYKNDVLGITNTYNVTDYVRNVLRTSNYLGKSNWQADKYFNGLIYNFKITDSKGNPIIWYDLNL